MAHVTSIHKPNDNRIFERECRTLAFAGYSVCLIAPALSDTVKAGVEIRAIVGSQSRLTRMTKTVWQAYRAAIESRAEICHLHDPELLLVGVLLRIRGKAVIFDSHEDVVDDLMTKDYVPHWFRTPLSSFFRLVLWLMGFWLSGFVAATPTIAKRFPEERTVLIRNYPYLDEARKLHVTTDGRPARALYLGNVTRIRGIFEMVKAIDLVSSPEDASLVVVGEFESEKLLNEAQKLRGWKRVQHMDWQPRENFPAIMSGCAVGLVLFHPLRANIEAWPNKLFEYMAAGLPLIASDFPMWRELIQSTGCGVVVDPLNPKEISDAMSFIFSNPQRAVAMGNAGRSAVLSTYNWEPEGERLVSFYDRILTVSPWPLTRGGIEVSE